MTCRPGPLLFPGSDNGRYVTTCSIVAMIPIIRTYSRGTGKSLDPPGWRGRPGTGGD